MKIPFATFEPMHEPLHDEMLGSFEKVYNDGVFIKGEECERFEEEFARYCGASHAIGVASGLDALTLALKALDIGPGDEVIVPANTFIATALAVSQVGADLVLADPNVETYNLDLESVRNLVTEKTKAIIPVHLYGQSAEIEEITDFAKSNGVFIVEDCAQAHGARYNGKHVGTFGDVGCFSFYPGKNLGALGDGGAVITNNSSIAERIKGLANYGSKERYVHLEKGCNSRLDELQAAFLRIKLPHLDEYNDDRRRVADRYLRKLRDDIIVKPVVGPDRNHVWHIFAVRTPYRDQLKDYLESRGIGVNRHYPITIADQGAYADNNLISTPLARELAATELSLPLYVGMTDEEIDYVVEAINEFTDFDAAV